MKTIKLILSLIKQINAMKNLKDWKTTVTGLAVLLTQALEFFQFNIPANISEILIAIAGVLLIVTKDPNSKV